MNIFRGANLFRQRITLSLLSGKPIKIQEIRTEDENPGLLAFEIKFLKLIEQITNGTHIEINFTGTEVIFRPGTIFGGELSFDCGTERSLVYYIEPILLLAPFSKFAFKLTLDGITSEQIDQTIDGVKNINLKLLKWFGVDEGVDFKIIRRGAHPLGGGKVYFTSPVVQALKPISLLQPGRIKRIRGIASATRVSPQIANRLVEASRGLLNSFIPDIYIYTDVFRGEDSGKSPGFSLFLQAESTEGAILSADGCGEAGFPAEELAKSVTLQLLREIKSGGFVDQAHQWMLFTLMALCPEDLSKITLGALVPNSAILFDDIKILLGVSFKIRDDFPQQGLCSVSCIGSGYSNLNRRIQ